MSHYEVLGVKPTDSPDDIKKAYKSLAKKHHPDGGGDVNMFHKISEAYETLADPHQRAKYDHKLNVEKLNKDFDWVFPQKRSYTKKQNINKNLSATIELELEEILAPTIKTISLRSINGERHLVNVDIPPGIKSGAKIKYPGLGDRTYASQPYGDLIVNFIVKEHDVFARTNSDLLVGYTINVWDAIVGTTAQIHTLENRLMNVNIPAGTQFGTTLRIPEYGLPNNNGRGDLLVKVLVKIPENLSEQELNICKAMQDKK